MVFTDIAIVFFPSDYRIKFNPSKPMDDSHYNCVQKFH
jgi:hypothetical protein